MNPVSVQLANGLGSDVWGAGSTWHLVIHPFGLELDIVQNNKVVVAYPPGAWIRVSEVTT